MNNMVKAKNEMGIPARFFTAIVENNDDPENRGRVQVRVVGLHTEIKVESELEGIETGHLPWADPILAPQGGGISGRGVWPDAPENGSLVLLFFLDGSEYQKPFYFGVLAGTRRLEANTELGFNDPAGLWPRKDRVPNEDIPGPGDPPFHKDEKRKILGETYFNVIDEDIKQDNPDKVKGAFDSDEWRETGPGSFPEGRYNCTEEHHPRDYESEDPHERHGYIKEVDSTPDKEGVREYYARSASYRQINGAGEEKLRLKDGREHVIFNKDRQHIKGFQNIIIDKERYVLVNSNAFYEIVGDLEEKIKNMRQEVENLKRVQAKKVVHHTDRHNLDSDNNTRPVCNFQQCPVLKIPHASQRKTFCSP